MHCNEGRHRDDYLRPGLLVCIFYVRTREKKCHTTALRAISDTRSQQFDKRPIRLTVVARRRPTTSDETGRRAHLNQNKLNGIKPHFLGRTHVAAIFFSVSVLTLCAKNIPSCARFIDRFNHSLLPCCSPCLSVVRAQDLLHTDQP